MIFIAVHWALVIWLLADAATTTNASFFGSGSSSSSSSSETNNSTNKSFLNGRYTTTSDLGDAALITLDMRDIIASSSGTDAQTIYEKGKNAGQSLQAMALSFPNNLKDEPYYQFFVYAAKRNEAIKSEALTYADSIIQHLFTELLMTKDDTSDDAMAGEAVVAILFWMQHVHYLYQALNACELGSDLDVPQYLDRGFAIYVGEGQQTGVTNTGYSLYSLAEKMASLFNTENTNTGEAYVNERIIMLYSDLQNNFIFNNQNNACENDPIQVPKRLRAQVQKIIHLTTVPIVQALLQYLQKNEPVYAEIYALQLIPLMGMCSPAQADTLQSILVSHPYNASSFNTVLHTLQASYDCFGITCADVGAYETNAISACQDQATANLAGFITSVDVREPSKIDRDIFQMGILLSQNAIIPARSIFTKGLNSMVKDPGWANMRFSQSSSSNSPHVVYQSLRDLAEDDRRINTVPYYQNFKDYLNDADYGYELITMQVARQDPYSQNTPLDQITEGVAVASTAIVAHHAALEHFYTAYQICVKSPDNEQAIFSEWDTGVAYVVGSMEKSEGTTEGQLMYALAKSTCSTFGTCPQITDALFAALRQGPTENYYIGTCDSIQQAASNVTGVLQAVLIQATIKSALDNKSNRSARGYVLATALMPILLTIDEAAAKVIENNMRYSDSQGGSDSDAVWSAFTSLIPKMTNVTCSLIGSVQGKPSLCPATSSQQTQSSSSKGVNLAGYVPASDVTYVLNWSKDTKEMLDATTPKDAKNIFMNGSNTQRPLADLSLSAEQKMYNEPIFNIYRYSLAHIGPLKEGKENGVSEFAKTIIMDVFNELGNETQSYYGGNDMVVEAVQLNILFMEVIHGLYAAALQCSIGRVNGVAEALDGAAAFYVGVDQKIGDKNTGYSVYHLAEKMGAIFGTTNGNISSVNEYIMREFIALKSTYLVNNTCAQNPVSASLDLMSRINGMVNKMKVVPIQSFIYYLSQNRKYYMELYAFHITPLVSTCDYALSEELEETFINSQSYNTSMFSDIIRKLQSLYSCLGISCTDVGSIQGTLPPCNISLSTSAQPFQSVIRVNRLIDDRYITLTDQTDFSDILDDIRDIVNAPSVASAKKIFEEGKNAKSVDGTVLTLASLSINAASRMINDKYFNATQTTLGLVPALDDGNGFAPDFAYKIISDVFTELFDSYGDPSDDAMAGEALILTLVSMEIWHNLDEAVRQCNKSGVNMDAVSLAIDRAAMLYVGLNQTYGSSSTGYSFYRLAEYLADFFGTYSNEGESAVNSDIVLAFDEIKRNFLLSNSCLKDPTRASRDLALATAAIVTKMKVVLVQGLLMYLGAGEYNYAELYALVVSPLISLCDKSVSYSIIDKLIINKAAFAPSMMNSIVSDIQSTYECLGIKCEDVGAYSDADGTIIVSQCGNGTAFASDSRPIILAGYTSTRNVTHILNLYEDVKEMSNASSAESAKTIFMTGVHAEEMPLANYSLLASSEMFNEPIFNMYRYSLANIVPLTGGDKVVDQFAETIILDVLDETVSYYGAAASDHFAAEAVKLNIFFMEVIHSLYFASYQCSLGDTQAVAQALDEAVAFYVGPDQVTGDDASGYSLYNLAEKMGTLFGTVSTSNTSLINDFVISEFIQLQDDFVKAKTCEMQSASASSALVQRANKIINKMKATSVQSLIHYMYQNKTYYSELYALHMTPLVAICDYALSEELKDMLIKQKYNSSIFSEILSKIEETYSCLGIGCSDVGTYKEDLQGLMKKCTPSIGEYRQPFTDVIRVNRLIDDRYMTLTDQSSFAKILDDIRDVVNAPTAVAAKEIFFNGKNAKYDNGDNITLSSLSTSAAYRIGSNRYFDAFQTTLGAIPAFNSNSDNLVPDYANQIVGDVFSELVGTYYDDPSDNALAGEALILTLVSMEIWHYLDEAVLQCGNSSAMTVENVAIAIDRAAMMYVGMSQTYGSSLTGYSFYRLAEYVSNYFGTQSSDNESAVNSEVLDEFDNIKKTFLLSNFCLQDPVTASRQLQLSTENIIDKMIVVMVQGLLMYLIAGELNYAELYALQVAPLASLCDQSVALDLIDKLVTKKSIFNSSKLNLVVSEIQGLYDCWGISCDDVGSYNNASGLVLPPCRSGPLCFVGYCPTSPINSTLGYMEDLRDIANAKTAAIAKGIFSSGNNRGDGKSLSSLSAAAKVVMANDPYYNIFKYSLANVAPLADSASGISDFGGTIVQSVFKDLQEYYDDQLSDSMAAEAVVLHVIFFEIVHNLFAAASYCEKGNSALVAATLDEAFVFYVGVDQQAGDANSGYSWYNLAERMATQFGTTGDSGSSVTNEFFVGKMKDLKNFYGEGNTTCSQNPTNSSAALLQSVQEIVAKLKVVSLQSLIHYMHLGEKYFVELYALHLTPFVSICDFGLSEELEDKLIISASDLEASVFDDILGKVQGLYSCMGVSCSDIGAIDESQQGGCTLSFDQFAQPYSDVIQVNSLIDDSYITLTDQADFGGILDDIRDVVNANSIGDAKAVFFDGKNAKEKNGSTFTLASLSTTAASRMGNSKYFEAFQSTLGSVPALSNGNMLAPDYGYKIVSKIFTELAGTLSDPSDDAMAGEALILTVVAMEIWNYLDAAVIHCGDKSAKTVEEVAFSIDRAAMLYIGTNQTYGSDSQGFSFYRLAEYVSNNFGTISSDGESYVNSDILAALNSIKQNFLMSNACIQNPVTASRQLQSYTEVIISKMKVVMVQGLLFYMAANELNYAELYALQVSPLISLCDNSVTKNLLDKFVLKDDQKYVPSMLNSTVSEIQSQYECLGITCMDVGSYTDINGAVLVPKCTDVRVTHSVSLAGYKTSTNVDVLLNTTLDVAAIRKMANLTEARTIYENGLNSYGSDGVTAALSDWSHYADWDMSTQPYFNFFKYALLRVGALSSNNDVSNYAGTIVQDIFLELGTTLGDQSDDEMAAEAIVITHYWMQVVRHLYDAISGCEAGNTTTVAAALDLSVAAYVGLDQKVGDNQTGYVLYNLAEKMSNLFGTETQYNGTSQVNHNIMSLFSGIQNLSHYCQNDTSASHHLHFMANEIIHQMTVPLVQGLIYYMEQGNEAAVELYALQITPLVATCSEVKYINLQDLLILSKTGYTYDMQPQVIKILESSFPCVGITCADIGTYGNYTCNSVGLPSEQVGIKQIVGYDLSSNVDEELKIDLDMRQISMLLSVGAYTAAESIITRGQNSIILTSSGQSAYRSIKDLVIDKSELYNFIFNVTNQDPPFNKISAEQTAGLVTEAMRTIVGYNASLTKLKNAENTCSDNTIKSQISEWEGALAYLVGSMEGPEPGGNLNERGQMLYALAKENCFSFDTCTNNSDSKLNEELLALFRQGKDELAQSACGDLSTTAERIRGVLLTILIQGTLKFALVNADLTGDSKSEDLARGYIISQALYPELEVADSNSAGIIEWNMAFPVANNPVPDGSDVVFTAFATIIPLLKNVNCAEVGNVTFNGNVAGVCPVNDGNASTADPQGLSLAMDNTIDQGQTQMISNGLYVSSSYVADRLNIAQDVWDISKALQSKNVNLARSIYREGLNSEMRDNEGQLLMRKRNIADFSLMAGQAMSEDLPFNIFKYALQDNYGYYNGAPVEQYADTFVEKAFDNTLLPTLAVEAIVALNIWMAVVHELYDQVNQCKNEAILVTGVRGLVESTGPLSVDIAAAYYIGDGQQTGSSQSGHMLYHLAEETGELFGQDSTGTGEAEINTKVLSIFNKIKSEIAFADACTARSSTVANLRVLVDKAVSYMTVPLLQNLIHEMKLNDPYRVHLYALSVTPLIAGCNEATYSYLRSSLIDNDYDPLKFNDILAKLQGAYRCLGISCADVGEYKGGAVPQCQDPSDDNIVALAGYLPTTNVFEQSEVDLDIQQIKILVSMGAMEAANDLYIYGRNSGRPLDGTANGLLSLHSIATDPTLNSASSLKLFSDYYSTKTFADSVVTKIFTSSEPYKDLTLKQKAVFVTTALDVLVMYMFTLALLDTAISDCNAADIHRNAFGTTGIDLAAASIIGSMEGHEDGGSQENAGLLLYSLSKINCGSMHTCATSNGDSQANDRLELLLYAAQTQLVALNCVSLSHTVAEIESVLKTVLIQSLIYSVSLLERADGLSSNSKNILELNADISDDKTDFIKSYLYTLALVPSIDKANPQSSFLLAAYMAFENLLSPPDSLKWQVFYAIADAVADMPDIDCSSLGYIDGMDPCDADRSHLTMTVAKVTEQASGIVSSTSIGRLALLSQLLLSGAAIAWAMLW